MSNDCRDEFEACRDKFEARKDKFEANTNTVESYNKFVQDKYDLEELVLPLYRYRQKLYEALLSESESVNHPDLNSVYADGMVLMDRMRVSYLSVAYNYNRLLDEIVQDIYWDTIKYEQPEEDWVSMGRRTDQIIIQLQNCLVSIKMALDRSIKLFRLYKKGIPEYTTFGHINPENNKAKGFMAQVIRDKDKDEILEYVYQQYHEWIYQCVQPRDTIIHYDDIQVVYEFTDGMEMPGFVYRKANEEIEITYEDVSRYVKAYYAYMGNILDKIVRKILQEKL